MAQAKFARYRCDGKHEHHKKLSGRELPNAGFYTPALAQLVHKCDQATRRSRVPRGHASDERDDEGQELTPLPQEAGVPCDAAEPAAPGEPGGAFRGPMPELPPLAAREAEPLNSAAARRALCSETKRARRDRLRRLASHPHT